MTTTGYMLKGPPRDWRTKRQHPAATAQITAKLAANKGRPCDHPGCDKVRNGISKYCRTHQERHSSHGDTLASTPTTNQLRVIKQAIQLYLLTNPSFAETLRLDIESTTRARQLSPSFTMGPNDVHRGIPAAGKATGLLANWYHKHKRTYADLLLHAVAMEAWVAIYYDGHAANRKRFLMTHIGKRLGHFSKMMGKKEFLRTVTGAVHRYAGSRIHRDMIACYQKAFWDRSVTTKDGQQMTLLMLAKTALRAAKLL